MYTKQIWNYAEIEKVINEIITFEKNEVTTLELALKFKNLLQTMEWQGETANSYMQTAKYYIDQIIEGKQQCLWHKTNMSIPSRQIIINLIDLLIKTSNTMRSKDTENSKILKEIF